MTSDGSDAERLREILRASPTLMGLLRCLRRLDIPQWRVVSGAVYQTVWNSLTGRDPNYGIKDYDIFYYHPDLSWEAEDVIIQRVAAACPAPLRDMVEVRNQARVHLWFHDKFGEEYPALRSADEALTRFVCPGFAVGVRLEVDDHLDVVAPFGLSDLFALRLSPNPSRPLATSWDRVTDSALERWPEAHVTRGSFVE